MNCDSGTIALDWESKSSFNPLAGKSELRQNNLGIPEQEQSFCFNPLAGKSELRQQVLGTWKQLFQVSIPLRGKVNCDSSRYSTSLLPILHVSIPLRGKVNCDANLTRANLTRANRFNPLAGKSELRHEGPTFSKSGGTRFQSPCGEK